MIILIFCHFAYLIKTQKALRFVQECPSLLADGYYTQYMVTVNLCQQQCSDKPKYLLNHQVLLIMQEYLVVKIRWTSFNIWSISLSFAIRRRMLTGNDDVANRPRTVESRLNTGTSWWWWHWWFRWLWCSIVIVCTRCYLTVIYCQKELHQLVQGGPKIHTPIFFRNNFVR